MMTATDFRRALEARPQFIEVAAEDTAAVIGQLELATHLAKHAGASVTYLQTGCSAWRLNLEWRSPDANQ